MQEPSEPRAVRLKPGVAIVERRSDGALLLANLVWQKFFRLAAVGPLAVEGDVVRSMDKASQPALAALVGQDMAEWTGEGKEELYDRFSRD